MALRNIVQEPDEQLRKVCKEVKSITPRIETLLADMYETLKQADGVGLAAPQVGVLRRLAIIDVGTGLIELINPVILETEGEQTGQEGCLSCGNRYGIVTRPMKVKVQTEDREGNLKIIEGQGLLARALCHEIDHLDGNLFIDIMTEEIFEDDDDEYEYEEGEEIDE